MQAKTRAHAATSWVFCAFVVVFRIFENAGAPSPAWPSENDHSQLQVADVTIAVEIAPGRLTLSRDQVLAWISEAARAVVHSCWSVSRLATSNPGNSRAWERGTLWHHLWPASPPHLSCFRQGLLMKSFCVGIG